MKYRIDGPKELTGQGACYIQNQGPYLISVGGLKLKVSDTFEASYPVKLDILSKGAVSTVSVIASNADDLDIKVSDVEGKVTSLEGKITAIEKGYIKEAPKDGEAYVRKDGAWVKLSDFLTPEPEPEPKP